MTTPDTNAPATDRELVLTRLIGSPQDCSRRAGA